MRCPECKLPNFQGAPCIIDGCEIRRDEKQASKSMRGLLCRDHYFMLHDFDSSYMLREYTAADIDSFWAQYSSNFNSLNGDAHIGEASHPGPDCEICQHWNRPQQLAISHGLCKQCFQVCSKLSGSMAQKKTNLKREVSPGVPLYKWKPLPKMNGTLIGKERCRFACYGCIRAI
jgi:hypothetical protein